MKICIIGGGAIGTMIGARLGAAGAAVTLLTRRPFPNEANSLHRLVLTHPQEKIEAEVPVTRHASSIGPQDIVIVAVKTPDLPNVVDSVHTLLDNDTTVVFANNGIPWWYFYNESGATRGKQLPALDPDGRLWRDIGPQRSAAAVVYALSTAPKPGIVHVENKISRILLGGSNEQTNPRLQYLAQNLRSPSCIAEVSDRIRDVVWEKLAVLLATAPMAVLTQSAPRDFLSDAVCADIARKLMGEVVATANAIGRNVQVDIEAMIDFNKSVAHKPSILQDLENSRRMEVDAIFTLPCQLGREAGVNLPTMEAMSSLVKARARAAGLY
jgi:2-dehydropantoate 2-reductase